MGNLETALKLRAVGDGQWRGRADPAYEAIVGMFGGMTAALLLKAVTSASQFQGSPSALTVNFVRSIPPGSDVEVVTRLLGETRSIQNWSAQLSLAGSPEVYATASVVSTMRRESEDLVQLAMPDVPVPESLEIFHPPGTFGQQSPVRIALGAQFDTGSHLGRTHSAAWVREISGRAIDEVQVAYLCDNYAPRSFYLGKGPGLSATIAYSVYFLASTEEFSEVGDDFTLIEAIATRAGNSTVGSRANLWARSGKLLATSEQLCWFR